MYFEVLRYFKRYQVGTSMIRVQYTITTVFFVVGSAVCTPLLPFPRQSVSWDLLSLATK
jgi:hypothetical protein